MAAKDVTLLIGEAPSRGGSSSALAGAVGRWARLLGVDESSFAGLERANLLDRWPGPASKGSAFPLEEARLAGLELRQREAGRRRVIFVGKRVARAMGYANPPLLEWREDVGSPSLGSVAVVPHPSGINRQYNDPELARRSARFVLDACSNGAEG